MTLIDHTIHLMKFENICLKIATMSIHQNVRSKHAYLTERYFIQ